MKRHHESPTSLCEEPDVTACDRPPLERLRFWDGRFLVARDLRHQQADLIRRLEYHQKFAHGSGVVCGFHVKDHPRRECRPGWIVLASGMAYDCCGRTLWMPEDRAVELDLPGDREPSWERFLAVRLRERLTDPMPALYSDDVCDPLRREYGRVHEDVEVALLDPDQVSERCWPRRKPLTQADCEQPGEDDCDVPLGDAPPCACGCACDDWVVLARLSWEPRTRTVSADTTHRRLLAPPGGLTAITGVNWPHGGTVDVDTLLDDMDGTLVVRFSRPLRPPEGMARGVNGMTFTVSYMTQGGVLEQILPPDAEDLDDDDEPSPRLSPNRRCALFEIPSGLLRGSRSLVGAYIVVQLRCDFIADCHGRMVSGAHLGGDVSGRGSGNGVEGGLFESWFHLTAAPRRGEEKGR